MKYGFELNIPDLRAFEVYNDEYAHAAIKRGYTVASIPYFYVVMCLILYFLSNIILG